MRPVEGSLVQQGSSIREAIAVIDRSALQIALVVDAGQILLGTVTDGDVRRALLQGRTLDEAVDLVMNPHPTTARPWDPPQRILRMMRARHIHQVPLVGESGLLCGLIVLDDLLESPLLAPGDRAEGAALAERLTPAPTRDNLVVIMAGGKGTRLRPITETVPKPMIYVGGRPILESILEGLQEAGFQRVLLSVNYKAEMIEGHFGDGSDWGLSIDYIREDKPLGTAGCLGLLAVPPQAPFLVMNGDLLTSVDYSALFLARAAQDAEATMCVREYDFQVPYGVVQIEDQLLTGLIEKPVQRFFVNAGIYLLSPSVFDLVPRGEFFNMTDLFNALIAAGRKTSAFPIREYWLDIGQHQDLEQARKDAPGVLPT